MFSQNAFVLNEKLSYNTHIEVLLIVRKITLCKRTYQSQGRSLMWNFIYNFLYVWYFIQYKINWILVVVCVYDA